MPPSKRKIACRAASLKKQGDPTLYEQLQIERTAKVLLKSAVQQGIKKKEPRVAPVRHTKQKQSDLEVPPEAEGLRLHVSRSSSGYRLVRKISEHEYRIVTSSMSTVHASELEERVFSSGISAAVAIAKVLGEPRLFCPRGGQYT